MKPAAPTPKDLEVAFHRSDEQNNDEYKRVLQKAIHNEQITEDDRKLINLFIAEASGQSPKGISSSRKLKICRALVLWRKFVGEYRTLEYADLMIGIGDFKVSKNIKGTKYKPNTQRDHVLFLKRFLLWLEEEEITTIKEKKIRKISAPPADKATKTIGDILTYSEVRLMLDACSNSRDRALLSILYEGGLRVGEIGAMTWKDVEFRSTGLVISTDFKTGFERRIPLANSVSYLSAWKDDYPYEISDDMPVFLTMVNNSPKDKAGERDPDRPTHRGLTYAGVRKQVRKIAAKAGIEKNISMHTFRHSRISHLVKAGYPESYVKLFAWGSLSSEMLSTYLHLDDSYVDEVFYQHEGITPADEFEKNELEAIQCPRCANVNSNTSQFCRKCGLPLSDETAQTLQLLSERVEKSMLEKLQNDPEEFKKIVDQFL